MVVGMVVHISAWFKGEMGISWNCDKIPFGKSSRKMGLNLLILPIDFCYYAIWGHQ